MAGWAIDFVATAPPEDSRSGLSRVVWDLSSALAARGHAPRVLYPSEPFHLRPPYRGVECVPVPVVKVKREPYGRERAIARAASALLDPASELIVANDEKGGVLDLPRGRHGRRPLFAMFVHDVQQHHLRTMQALPGRPAGLRGRLGAWLDRRTIERLERTALERAVAILVSSRENERLLRELYAIPPNRIHPITLPVPMVVPVGTREQCRQDLRIPPDVPVVAFIGQNPERQGLPLALESFRRVRALFAGVRLLVVGSVGKSEPGVMYLGVVDEETKARALRAADVFLCPARYEGFGLAPREAMRAGLATIVSAHVPFEDAEGEVVRVVAEDSAPAFASELAALLADPEGRRALGERGRLYAERFTPERSAEGFERIFAPLLGRGA
jgi:glycosyltransferase involved in cell wall biosynthesis